MALYDFIVINKGAGPKSDSYYLQVFNLRAVPLLKANGYPKGTGWTHNNLDQYDRWENTRAEIEDIVAKLTTWGFSGRMPRQAGFAGMTRKATDYAAVLGVLTELHQEAFDAGEQFRGTTARAIAKAANERCPTARLTHQRVLRILRSSGAFAHAKGPRRSERWWLS